MKNYNLQSRSGRYPQIIRMSLLIALSVVIMHNPLSAQENSSEDVLSNPEYSIFYSALSSMNLDNKKSSSGAYTFFAPTNEAFKAQIEYA